MFVPVKTIIDHAQARRNRKRAQRLSVDGADFLLCRAIEDCVERLGTVQRTFKRALIVGPSAHEVGAALVESGQVVAFDAICADGFPDDEVLPVDKGSCDLAVSLLALHETNDTPGLMIQIGHALKPDGFFIACIAGGETLSELRESLMRGELETSGGAHMRVLPFMDVRDAGALLQRTGYALPVTDTEKLTVRYDTLFDLARDLRAMGASNTLAERSRAMTARGVFLAAARHYAADHSDPDGRMRATFEMVWLTGWKPDASQPKPLKPGVGKVSLADVLKSATEED